MKKLVGLVLGLLLASSAFAERPEQPNEVFVGIGDAGLVFMIDDIGTTIVSLGTITYGEEEGGFQIVAGYQRWLNGWASVGATGSWAGARKTAYFMGDRLGRVERRILTLMVDGRAHWLRRPSLQLYSGLSIGIGALSDDLLSVPDENDSYPCFHIIPVGLRIGREWGGFAETGFGLNGFMKAGLSRRF